MKRSSLFILSTILFTLPLNLFAQELPPASELLQQSLDHHDPERQWYSLNHTIEHLSRRPTGDDRLTTVLLHHNVAAFGMQMKRDGLNIETSLKGSECEATIDGSTEYTAEQEEAYRLNCEGITRWRDYHGYMLGLPMIIQDPGAILDPVARRESFMGNDVITLKVTYEPGVGGDTWYFYLDPESYAIVGCRFYHDESKNDGEYITFEGEIEAGDIRLPKVRKWYYNSNDEFLGEDDLVGYTAASS